MLRVARARAVSFLRLQDCKEFNGIDPRGQRPDRLIGRKETESKEEEEAEGLGGGKEGGMGRRCRRLRLEASQHETTLIVEEKIKRCPRDICTRFPAK